MAEQSLPRQFGKYILMRRIAMGGMAEIFKAKTAGAEGFEKDIVIKRILPHFTDDEAFVKMFIDEASITSKLQHANIVQIFDFDLCEGTYYIAMEYVEGVDLKDVIDNGLKEGTPLSVAQIAYTMMELSKGLHYAHVKEHKGKALNIVHRDISPHNAMVSYTGEVKLMDFGIAKAAQRSTKTMVGTVKGKVAYMSPEQARGKPLDGRSDLFALGIMMWEMLTGKRLFLGDSDFETLTNVLKSDAPPPSSINPKVPKEIDLIVLKMLEKDRTNRHATVEAFNRELTRWYYSTVTDLESEALKPFMETLFAKSISKLKAQSDEEKALVVAPAADAERTIAMPIDPQGAATLLDDGSISQDQIRAAMNQQNADRTAAVPTAGTGTYSQQGFTGTYNGAMPQKKGRGLLIAIIALLFLGGGGAAAYFLTQGKVEAPAPKPPVKATAELVIKVTPSTAKVKVNDKLVDGIARGLALNKAAKVTAEAEGYERYEEFVPVKEESQKLSITLSKKRAEVSFAIMAKGDTGATIKVGGNKLGVGSHMYRGHEGDEIEIEIIPSTGADPIKKKVTLAENMKGVLEILVGPPPATLVKLLVKVKPASATVAADKGSAAKGAAGSTVVSELPLNDEVTLTVSNAGYATIKKKVKVSADGQVESITLKKAGGGGNTTTPTATGGFGYVQINARPWAQVSVRGRAHGTTPQRLKLPAGRHKVTLTRGSQKVTKTVTIKPGRTSSLSVDMTK